MQKLLAALFVALLLSSAAAQECTWEIEPNDTPATATLITGAGPDSAFPPLQGRAHTACLAGELSGNDQDAFLWEIGEHEADQRWVIELEGIPGQLTRLDLIRVEFAENQADVTRREDLLSVGSNAGQRATSAGFLLEPGRYLIGVSKSGGQGEYVAHLRPTEALSYRSGKHEQDSSKQSEFTISGATQEGITQPWTVSAEDAQYVWRISLETALGSSAELILTSPDGSSSQASSDESGNALLDNFGLNAGQYEISVRGSTGSYRLRTSRQGRMSDGIEIEPNNDFQTATRFDPGTEMRGSITDVDFFRISVDEDAAKSAWTLDVQADGNLRLNLLTEDGAELLSRRGVSGSVDSLMLPTGDYQLRVDGDRGTTYTLALRSAQPPEAGWEVEPNDTPAGATLIGEDGQIRGQLGAQDTDVFRYEVNGEPQLYRVQLVGNGVSELTVLDGSGRDYASSRGERRIRLDNLLLLPGSHYFRVKGDDGEYALRVLPLGPAPETALEDLPDPEAPLVAAAAPVEQSAEEAAQAPATAELPPLPPPPPGVLELEPNDDMTRAELLTPGVPRVGTLPNPRDTDYYRFHLAEDQPVRIELVPPAGMGPLPFRLSEIGWVENREGEPGAPTVTEQWLLAGDHYLELRSGETGSSYYQLRLTQLNAALPWIAPGDSEAELQAAPLNITLESSNGQLAAYWHEGQGVQATARIENTSSEPQDVNLQAAVTDARVKLDLPASLQLAAGESRDVPLEITIPADLRDDLPLRVSLAATTSSGSSGASLAFAATCEALPVNSTSWWPVPEPLLGGIDMLWSGLGASIHGSSPYERRDNALLDGIITPAYGGYLGEDHYATFKLAGSEPVELAGALLHPLSNKESNEQLRNFRIETSLDGLNFTLALEAELRAARIEQAFIFEQPILAKYARIHGVDNQAGRESTYLGEVKLIARSPNLDSFNLADSSLGGHVVWSEPHIGSSLQTSAGRQQNVDLRDHPAFTFVLGFHNGRAAQISQLQWTDAPETLDNDQAFPSVNIEVSVTGAAGPWEPLSDWQLTRNASGTAALEFTEPVWARYLRFTAEKGPDEQRHWATPTRLAVLERAASSEYRSALGEWGVATSTGIFEYLQPPPTPPQIDTGSVNSTRETARPLVSGAAAEGTVLIGEDVDWYRFSIEPGHNHLEVRLSGEPAIAYEYELVDAAGNPAAYDLTDDGSQHLLSLYGEPGDYFLKVQEPKRTVVFSWDTSGSMGPFLEITYNALAGFARGVDGERESVQLLAYDDPRPVWLLPIWTGDAERVQRVVNNFNRVPDSSNSETALLAATRALADREGTRALLLITDAETTGYSLTPEVWRALEEVRPRIFTFEVSSIGSVFSQQLMQDWAAVNHGHYSLAASIGDLDVGYNRASCHLRRPKHYRIEVQSSSAPLPGPGSLSVTRPAGADQPAVEIIFDASGSMGVDLPSGEQRITAAKRVLESLVSEVLPEGSPFALRAFGHVKPATCDTRLEVPFGPLDREQALAAVRAIEMKLLSQTPLAESLAAVATDLAQAGRSRTVILITDGEESCGGDPADAVRELRRQHPLDLAIVSLGIEASERQSFEALAAAVGASYVDVTSFEELKASVDSALHPAFEVLDSTGQLVASGRVDGEAVQLEMGVYTVRVQGAPPREFHDVRVPGEKSVTLTVSGE